MYEATPEKIGNKWNEMFDHCVSPWYLRGYKISDWQLLEDLPTHELTALNIGAAYPIDALNIGWQFKHYTESDFTKEIVDKMRGVHEKAYPKSFHDNVEFAIVDATNMPQYVDKSFNLVITYSSLDHIPEALKAIAEMCRVSSQYVCITLPNALDKFNANFSEEHPERFGYERYWYPQEIVRAMLDQRFIPIKYNNNEGHVRGNRFGYLFERLPEEN